MPPKFKRDYKTEIRSPEGQSLLDDDSDEDFFLHGPRVTQPNRAAQRDPKVARLQEQVGDVVTVMQDNISKVVERGGQLDDLQEKSDTLAVSSEFFRSRARTVRNQMWWKECKMRLILAVVIIVILIIIIVPIIFRYKDRM